MKIAVKVYAGGFNYIPYGYLPAHTKKKKWAKMALLGESSGCP